MTDLSHLTAELARDKIADRVAYAERSRIPGQRRPHGRHALAQRLHRLADRLEG
jgi:hypothetical protein